MNRNLEAQTEKKSIQLVCEERALKEFLESWQITRQWGKRLDQLRKILPGDGLGEWGRIRTEQRKTRKRKEGGKDEKCKDVRKDFRGGPGRKVRARKQL